MNETEWKAYVKGLLKAEIGRRNLAYKEVCDKLAEIGIEIAPDIFKNKLSRGTFSAVFCFQVLTALGVKVVRLEEE